MTRRLITAVALILLVAGTAQASVQDRIADMLGLDRPSESVKVYEATGGEMEDTRIVVWGLATTDADSPDNEFVLRFGVQLKDIELGYESLWRGAHGDGQTHGVYVLMHLEGDISSWLGRPYIGYHASLIDTEDGGFYGPVAGTVYWDVFVMEVWYRDFTGKLKAELDNSNDIWKVTAGARFAY